MSGVRRDGTLVVMIGVPDEPMLTLVSAEELAERHDRRGPATGLSSADCVHRSFP